MAADPDDTNSYSSPFYANLALATEQKLGLPAGLLASVITKGERSNADQVSDAGARTVAQIIPSTRKAAIDKWGIDPYLSPQNAVEVSGLLLKDSLDRNGGSVPAAVGEYIGGTDRKNWGPTTNAYIARVVSGQKPIQQAALGNDFASWMAAHPASPAPAAAPAAPVGDTLSAGFARFMQAGGPRTGAAAIPTEGEEATGVYTPPAATPPTPAPGIGDTLLGAGEAGLSTLTAATGGTLGAAAGLVHGVAGSVLRGDFGTPAAADRTEADAAAAAHALTYQPRTPSGQAQAAAVGDAIQQAIPVMPLTAELGGIQRAAAPALRAAGDVVVAPPLRRAPAATEAPIAAAAPDPLATPAAPAVAPIAPAADAVAPASADALVATAKKAAGNMPGSTAAKADFAAEAAPDPKTVAAAQRLGIEDYLQPDHVTTNQAFRELTQAVKSVPGSEARAGELAGLQKVADRATKAIDDIGGTTDLSALDAGVKGRMSSDVEALASKADDLYTQVRDAIPATTPTPAAKVLGFIKQRAEELGGDENLSPLEKSIQSKLTPLGGDAFAGFSDAAKAQMQKQGVSTGKEPTYALVDDVRKDVGAAARGGGAFKDADTGLAKRLYGLLSDDQAAVVDQHGMTPVYAAAKQAVAVRKGIEDDMTSLFGKALDQSIAGKLPTAMRAASEGNTAPIIKVLGAVPEDMRQTVVASGLAAAFRTAATRGDINFGTFAKWFDGLRRNKQSYTAVMSNLPAQARRQVLDLYRVSNSIAAATRERIQTGRIQAITQQFNAADALVARLYGAVRRGAVGAVVGTGVGHILGPGAGAAMASALSKGAKPQGIRAVDALITSPEFLSAAKAAGTPRQPAAIASLSNSAPFRRFMRAVHQQNATGQWREKWISNALLPAPVASTNRN